MKKLLFSFMVSLPLFVFLSGCGSKAAVKEYKSEEDTLITVGFSQLGAESDWRSENTSSMKSTLSRLNGYDLIFDDGQQKQSNQITAIRKFIQQEVAYIVLAPVTEGGWDTVLEEAKDANIPVIIVDRMIDTKNPNLFTCFVGSDFEMEAKKVTAWMDAYFTMNHIEPEDVHIVNLQGNIGATAQIGRTRGLEEACDKYAWDLLDEVTGEFTQAKGREVMESLLSRYSNLNVVYCENDNMALGAIEALEANGFTVGSKIDQGEIMVVSFDGVGESARELCKQGKISVIGECNPLHGPRVASIIETIEMGGTPEKIEYVSESTYSYVEDVNTFIVDGFVYSVSRFEE